MIVGREHRPHVEAVLALLHRLSVSVDDLIEIGGQDLGSSDSKRAEKARRVTRVWATMAQLGVKHVDLAPDWAPQPRTLPGLKSRRRRGEGVISQAIDFIEKSHDPRIENSSMRSMGAGFGESKFKSEKSEPPIKSDAVSGRDSRRNHESAGSAA